MAKITKISVQKRNKQRYSIYLDSGTGEEYGFSIDEDVLIKYGLKKGQDIDEEEIKKVAAEDERRKTYHLAIHFLSYRMRSVLELQQYLEKKERQQKDIAAVIEKLKEEKLLDDVAFAEAYVRTKKNTMMKGPLKLKQELKQKGVPELAIEQGLLHFSFEDQLVQLQKWLDKQKDRQGKDSIQAYKTKLAQRLIVKGFDRQAIEEAMATVVFEENEEEEWDALVYQGEKLKRKYSKKYEGWEYRQRIRQALFKKGFSITGIEKFIEEERNE
ncbi:recombination regulator RecX [Halalkalibacter urbisdiaboli]|uniref:recombination regulator RecX n=1 Tax=Halalkalibacter urbisdiaboli TaxID=1960589 RepID=UPI000B44F552|nr:recombination regulator RecX [Halalkalibacter urbisdiaboli]